MACPAQEAVGAGILPWAADPETPYRITTPYFHAAAAMDVPVEIYFTAGSVRLLVRGVAEQLRASARHVKTIRDALREAVDHGARMLACRDALHAHGIDPGALIAECSGRGGAVRFMARACDLRRRTLIF